MTILSNSIHCLVVLEELKAPKDSPAEIYCLPKIIITDLLTNDKKTYNAKIPISSSILDFDGSRILYLDKQVDGDQKDNGFG